MIATLNELEYDNKNISNVNAKGGFPSISWSFMMAVFAFLSGLFLYFHFYQEGIERFFYTVYASLNSIAVFAVIVFVIVFSQLSLPYWIMYIITSKNMKPNGKVEAFFFTVLYILSAVLALFFSFFGYCSIFSLGFSLLATGCWMFVLMFIWKGFADIERLNDYESRKFKLPSFLFLWIISLLMAFMFAYLFPIDRSYNFSKLFVKIGFVQNQPSWQKVKKSYLDDINNEGTGGFCR